MNEELIAKAYLKKAFNAKKVNQEWSISIAQFKKLYLQTHCYYSGEELSERGEDHVGKWNYPTYERVDASKGYIQGNVVVICHCLNDLKGQLEAKHTPYSFEMVQRMFNKINERNLK